MRVSRSSALAASRVFVATFVTAFGTVAASTTMADAKGPQLPTQVVVRPEPQGVTLADPAFIALPGTNAYFGRLGGSVFQIEIPDNWNGRLLLYMHGFQALAREASVQQPSPREYLIRNGLASSLSEAPHGADE